MDFDFFVCTGLDKKRLQQLGLTVYIKSYIEGMFQGKLNQALS